MTHISPIAEQPLRHYLAQSGFAFVRAPKMREMLETGGRLGDWADFAASWDRLERDTYMADGGRYRRRRHAVFMAGRKGEIARGPHHG